ncbi:MAG: recombinase family protein [Flavonifractor plautii]|nr:recombinase family protein [Flavonifractor plautii]MCR1921067.1 recombinase family protein [Flavonifractor plautii]MDY3699025.1 recombinase family protein [Flavonifractor plautii]
MDGQKKTSGFLALNSTSRVITIAPSAPVRDRKLRVAAYARVSSSSEDQLNSFAAQNAHYTELITANPEWEFVDVYADKGITGTSAEKRDDFQRLLADCRRDRVDKTLVKSSSRFARNAKECLKAIRELKALGVGVCFEEQGIDISKLAGEFLTAIFAMMDQKESENISDNLRWSIDMRMRTGKYNTCFAPFGYQLVGGKLELIPEQAPIIRYIYDAYLAGKTAEDIAATLNLFSDDRPWKPQRIDYILTNERYSGNALLRKRYATDTIPRKVKRNRGERPMCFVAGINEAVVSQEIFDKAQELRKKRWENRLVDPDIFISRQNELAEQLRAAKLEKERFLKAEEDQTIQQTQELIEALEAGPDFLDAFDGELFRELVDKIIVESNDRLRFRLVNGLELTEPIERTVR